MNGEAIESALDSIDDSLIRAEELALVGLKTVGTGITNSFSAFFLKANTPAVQYSYDLYRCADPKVLQAGLEIETYLDPIGSDPDALQRLNNFKTTFEKPHYLERIAILCQEQPQILIMFQELVPLKISESDFWMNYYFKLEEIELSRRLRSSVNQPLDDEVNWSSDEENKKVVQNDDGSSYDLVEDMAKVGSLEAAVIAKESGESEQWDGWD